MDRSSQLIDPPALHRLEQLPISVHLSLELAVRLRGFAPTLLEWFHAASQKRLWELFPSNQNAWRWRYVRMAFPGASGQAPGQSETDRAPKHLRGRLSALEAER